MNNEIYVNCDTHIRYVNNRILIFNGSLNAFPMTVNAELLKLLLVLTENNQLCDIKNEMLNRYSIEHSDTETFIQLLTPYITDNPCRQNYKLSAELRRTLNDYKARENVLRKSNHIIPKKSKPDLLSITVTKKCGRRCVYCFAADEDAIGEELCHMDLKLFESIIDQAETLGIKHIELTGGDPFALTNINEYVDYVIKHGMECFLSTKNLVGPDMVRKLYDAGLREIQISLDSCEERLADELMGVRGAYNQIIQSIRNFKNMGFKITVRCVILKQNIGGIPELIKLCEKLHVDVISFNLYGMSCGRHDSAFFASKDEIIHLTNKIDELKKQCFNLHIDYASKVILQYVKSRSYSMEYKHYSRGICGAMTNSMIIRSDGKVTYCANLMYLDEMIVGDLTKQSIMNVWSESSYKKLTAPDRKKFEGTQCASCDSFDYCINKRCYFRVWLAYRKLYDKDPMCKYGIKDFQTY
ncbi:MAG: hypothetical protein DBY04_03545 [Clostridiales bacterium]|nr:MAG: hypothetical protein DBY04_03545 [Clostridiales bacterium]